jgi:hypothetical protein
VYARAHRMRNASADRRVLHGVCVLPNQCSMSAVKGGRMSVIKPRTRGTHLVRLVTCLDRDTHETLHAYAQFLGESAEYVLNQVIDTVLAKDKEFLAWRGAHPESCMPRRPARRAYVRRRGSGRDVARASRRGRGTARRERVARHRTVQRCGEPSWTRVPS